MILQLVRRLPRFTASPSIRVSLGMSSLVVAMLLLLDLAFGVLPDPSRITRQWRERIAENLAMQTAALVNAGEMQPLDRVLRDQLAREKSLVAVTVQRRDGQIMAHAASPHASKPPRDQTDDADHIRVSLSAAGEPWGTLDVRFERLGPGTLWEWMLHPPVLIVTALGTGSFIAFALYMRRILSHLDPSTAIPDRVRSAFDVFSGGVMILDTQGRVMLANAALRSWMGAADAERLLGRAVETVPWFRKALPAERGEHPWVRAIESGTARESDHLEFDRDSDSPVKVIANSAPILDGAGKVRGCLVTLDNVTHLDNLNSQLLASMTALMQTKEEVERKNEELLRLATRDPLTGCLNRRALFEKLDFLFTQARDEGLPLCCIMTDIDHFKSFNDRHGHAVGDQVLQSTSQRLAGALRDMDVLARYGGEEFCIVLPGATLEQAHAVAERLRSDVEALAGSSIRSTRDLKVTSSFGLSFFEPGITDPSELIDRADQALYAAKKGGRNCVRVYDGTAEAA